ncbi:MAG: aminotransferase, partial [Megasphaera sp.]|nr:aminotransferase [Megasphaera sp.]
LIGVSSSKDVIDEFADLGKYSARTAWSNVNRAAMTLLTEIRGDQSLKARLDAERLAFADKLHRRGAVFVEEARSCGLQHVPYQGGFFISVPTAHSTALCQALQEDLIFAVPLAEGVRLGICSIAESKMTGLAGTIKKAVDRVALMDSASLAAK